MKIIIANWKSNGSLPAVNEWCAEVMDTLPKLGANKTNEPQTQFCVCSPHIFIAEFANKLKSLLTNEELYLGSQDISAYGSGAYTGEVNGQMLKEFLCSHAILGHSERRTLFGETDAALSAKINLAFAAGIAPIFCIGENLDERARVDEVLGKQLEPLLQALRESSQQNGAISAIVAYEPVWAIGTGQAATPTVANEVHAFIKGALADINPLFKDSIPVVYGGSVKPDNARDFTDMPDIDGLLVGGASLQAASILQIVENVA